MGVASNSLMMNGKSFFINKPGSHSCCCCSILELPPLPCPPPVAALLDDDVTLPAVTAEDEGKGGVLDGLIVFCFVVVPLPSVEGWDDEVSSLSCCGTASVPISFALQHFIWRMYKMVYGLYIAGRSPLNSLIDCYSIHLLDLYWFWLVL